MTEAKPLKAYEVREPDEGHCAIVFATNGAAARRLGSIKLNTEFEGVESCRRVPSFDEYAQAGEVPRRVLLKAGWWFECSYCSQRVSHEDYDDEGRDMAPAVSGLNVFCNQEHMMRHWAEWRTTQARHQAVIDAAHLYLGHLPIMVERVADYSRPWEEQKNRPDGDDYVATALIRFPGMQGQQARWVPSDPGHVTVCQIDLPAWEAMREAHKRAAP